MRTVWRSLCCAWAGQRRDKFGATVFKTIAAHNATPGAWLTAENRQSPADRDSYSKEARALHHIRVHRSPRPLTREPWMRR